MRRRDPQCLGVEPTSPRDVQPTPRRGTRRLGIASFSCLRTSNPLSLVWTDSAILQTTMALSSSTFNMLDEHCFRTMINQNLYEELVSKKKITLEVTFDLEDDEYPSIKEQITLRG
ncbi:hypothetical protein PIB30_083438 [Stylosanthes scabra]|uniref:Uncharacterized protein n=1 Tax=Stylosanthes scabra TaxID=79078 RepID=A0ABU6ST71_9FABA|nr:hypothetical protein [Stylosanthes scabra]